MKPTTPSSIHFQWTVCAVALFLVTGILTGRTLAEFDGKTLPSGAEIVRRNIDANGGPNNLGDFRSFFAKGVILSPDGTEKEFKVYRKRPQQMKTVVTDGRVETVFCFDGKRGWTQTSFKGGSESEVTELSGDELKKLSRNSYFDGPVLQHQERPENIRVIGFEEIDGEPVIRVEFMGLDPDDFSAGWISTKHFQTIRLAHVSINEAGEETIDEELAFSDFKKVNGVYIAMRSESRRGGELIREVRIDEVRPNVGIFDSFFDRP